MRVAQTKASAHVADAESAFLDAVQTHLSEAARKDLAAIEGPDYSPVSNPEVVKWARRWNVDAPCVIETALLWRDGTRTSEQRDAVPHAWRSRVNELSMGRAAAYVRVELSPVISDDAARNERQRLDALVEEAKGRTGERFDTVEWAAVRPPREFWEEELPRLRAEAHQRATEHALRPVLANPLYESWSDFQRRAKVHWDAMVDEAHRFGMRSETRPAREQHRDLDFLIKYQLHGLGYREISSAHDGLSLTPDTVRRAVEQFARLLKLRLREQRRGRPPSRKELQRRRRAPNRSVR